MLDELSELQILAIPLRNKFRGITVREVAIFRGEYGWSEFSPFLEYGDEESATWLQAALEAANTPWPTLYRERIPINATLPPVEPEEVPDILARFSGCKTIKIKIEDFDKGAQLVEAVLNIQPEMVIRLDVNGRWSAEQAILNLIKYHERFGEIFDYVEQPALTLSDLAKIKSNVPIRIAADESIRKNLSADFTNFSQYADVAILKWQPLGGFVAAHKIADEIQLPVVISSALETGIGISHGLALAASFSSETKACGLGTVALLSDDISQPDVQINEGFIEVKSREPVHFEKYLAPPERAIYWEQRILRALEVLERRRA